MNAVDQETTEEIHVQRVRDSRLVACLLRGERVGWDTFVGQYSRLIRWKVASVASGLGIANDESAIDDATAEVFAAVVTNQFAALRAYAGRSSLATYLTVIATRSATRTLAKRASETHQNRSLDGAMPPKGGASDRDFGNYGDRLPDEQAVSPIQAAITSEQQTEVHAALARLPPKQREIIERFHLRSETYRDISESMQIPIGSIGPTLRRAEQKLRDDLLDS